MIVTTGTFLNGLIHIGEEQRAAELTDELRSAKVELDVGAQRFAQGGLHRDPAQRKRLGVGTCKAQGNGGSKRQPVQVTIWPLSGQ